MACFHPLTGYRSVEDGGIVFNPLKGFTDLAITVPCGQCIGCRLERSRQWAIRCVHESSLWEQNSFITLTYDDDNLPLNGSIDVTDFQKFMKRLRKKYTGQKIRFFHCGEYGEKNRRPHYHACLFNFDFPDKKLYSERKKIKLYRSEILEKLWPFGFSLIGDVTFESAAYVARYITKKITGAGAEAHYGLLQPEYVTMSRRPGIGKGWFDKWKSEVYPSDSIIINGKEVRPPKYYDRQYELLEKRLYLDVTLDRIKAGMKYQKENTPERLRVRKKHQELMMEKLPRNLEKEDQYADIHDS